MVRRTSADRSKRDWLALRFRKRNEVFDIARGYRCVDKEDMGHKSDEAHGNEIALRAVCKFGIERGVDGDRACRSDQQCIAVGHRPRDQFRADRARCSTAIIYDDVLAPGLAKLLTDDSPYSIDRAAGRKRDNEPYWFVRVRLSKRKRGHKGEAQQ